MSFIPAPELCSMVSPKKDKKVNLKLLASIELKQDDGDVNEPFFVSLDFLSDGRLVTVDHFNKRCAVFNQNLERLSSSSLSMKPLGMGVVTEGEVAITTEDAFKLIFLNISKINEISVVRECDVKKKFESISVIDNDSMLVGCTDDSQPVRVVSMRGKERELGIDFPTKSYPIDSSACAYIRNRNKVVFSDRFAHTVYIYDKATNTRVVVKDEIIKEPRCLAAGPADCIFVCSDKTNSVVQISHTGQILSSHALDTLYQRSVCVSKDNTRLAVSNSAVGKMKLQLFNIELME